MTVSKIDLSNPPELYWHCVVKIGEKSRFAWQGSTLCALVEHPTARPGRPAEWWINLGKEIWSIKEGIGLGSITLMK